MARCGCGGSCGCSIIPGDSILISGGGASNDPYIISADPSFFDDFTGVASVNGIPGPNVALGAEDVGAEKPLTLAATASSATAAVVNTILPVNASAGAVIITLPVLVDADAALGRRIIVEKLGTVDQTRNLVTVKTGAGNTFYSGASSLAMSIPYEWMEFQAVKVAGVRYWKVVRAGFGKLGSDLIYAGSDQTPTLEELTYSCNFTVATAAQTEPIGGAQFDERIGAVNIQFNSTLAASDTNYWTVALYRYRGTETPQLIASKSTKLTGGLGTTAFNAWAFDNVNWLETLRYLRKGDGLVVVFTPTGAPAALGKSVVTVRYEPNVLANIRDGFNRNDSTTTLGSTETGEVWTIHTGTMGIKTAAPYAVALGNDSVSTTRAMASVQAGSTGGTATVRLGGPSSAGIGMRCVKNANGTTSGFIHDGVNFYRLDSSVTTNLGSFSTAFVAGDWFTWNITGNTHTIYKNGAQVLQVNDAAYSTQKGLLIRISTPAAVGVAGLLDELSWTA